MTDHQRIAYNADGVRAELGVVEQEGDETMTQEFQSAPRYVPCAIAGACLATWYDRREDRYVSRCPRCRARIVYRTLPDLYKEMVWSDYRCCQGCRAKSSFESDPRMIGVILDAWYRTGEYPQSPSWVQGIPNHQHTMWAEEILTGLEAATASTVLCMPGQAQ